MNPVIENYLKRMIGNSAWDRLSAWIESDTDFRLNRDEKAQVRKAYHDRLQENATP